MVLNSAGKPMTYEYVRCPPWNFSGAAVHLFVRKGGMAEETSDGDPMQHFAHPGLSQLSPHSFSFAAYIC